jgi:hypothetical protein
MTVAGADDPERTLAGFESAFGRLQGRRDALAARAASLREEVELAKGRLALKDEVETFIEAVHASANRRNLSSFETLLTALVQEVLPGEKPVSLQLSTERGRASLDICVARPDGTLEDVLEDNGGALTNVIGMALRLIAVVKAGAGRFLAFDEADCWIAPERVPAFYRVLEDAAARLDVQCLAVSHHDLSAFEGRFHVSRVKGDPLDGVEVISAESGPEWDPAQEGLRFVRLVNVQAFADATLRLAPGVNALVGPNNRGKSAYIRALRAVFYGEARDSLVRAGARSATVEIGLKGRRILRFTRQPRRSPVNVWSLHEADGSVVEEGGLRHESGGRAVPDWVGALCRIAKVEDLDVHIAHQKFPVFLLGEAPSRRSAVLSIGQEAGYIRQMLTIHRERSLRDNALVRNGEGELIEIEAALSRLVGVDGLRGLLDEARALAVAVTAGGARLDDMVGHRERIGKVRSALAAAEARRNATADLPDPHRLPAIRDAADELRRREKALLELRRKAAALNAATGKLHVLKDMPVALPELESASPARTVLARLAALRGSRATAGALLDESIAGLSRLEAEMGELLDDIQGRCPTCGSQVDADSLFVRHLHSAPSVTA